MALGSCRTRVRRLPPASSRCSWAIRTLETFEDMAGRPRHIVENLDSVARRIPEVGPAWVHFNGSFFVNLPGNRMDEQRA